MLTLQASSGQDVSFKLDHNIYLFVNKNIFSERIPTFYPLE